MAKKRKNAVAKTKHSSETRQKKSKMRLDVSGRKAADVVKRKKEFATAISTLHKNLEAYRLSPTYLSSLALINHQKMIDRAMVLPFERLLKSETAFDRLSKSVLRSQAVHMNKFISTYERNFIIPDYAKLFEDKVLEMTRIAEQYRSTAEQIHRAMVSMRNPWFDTTRPGASLNAFVKIQSIRSMVKSIPTFDMGVEKTLREDFGDWRTIDPPKTNDVVEHEKFYTERGFNPALTDFPSAAFDEITDLSALEETFGPPVVLTGEEEDALKDLEEIGRWQWTLEMALRQFIEQEMSKKFGEEWKKNRMPPALYGEWNKRQKAFVQKGEEEKPIIHFAHLGDLLDIICMKGNWDEVFECYFERKTSVQESFNRIFYVRHATFHTRNITKTSKLYFYVEAHRLGGIIRRRK